MAKEKKKVCSFSGCGRPSRALGLCQTHYKQKRKLGTMRAIKPKRQGREGTVRFAGLSLTRECAEAIDALARKSGVAANAVITDILEAWARRQASVPVRKPARRSPRSRAGQR
jgi:hypothetical protein